MNKGRIGNIHEVTRSAVPTESPSECVVCVLPSLVCMSVPLNMLSIIKLVFDTEEVEGPLC